MHIELVTHCYRYPTVLRYQLSSLALWPPTAMELTMTVFYAEEDAATKTVLEWFGSKDVPGVRWQWWPLPVLQLCRRSIGRNLAALATNANWVWFCDADHWFDDTCWKAMASGLPLDAKLVFPNQVLVHRTRELGDECISRTADSHGLVETARDEFTPQRMTRAIGGIQIVRGDVCRERGYLRDSARGQTPALTPEFTRCREDVWFRRSLGERGVRVGIPGVYRIRHTKAGRNTRGLVL